MSPARRLLAGVLAAGALLTAGCAQSVDPIERLGRKAAQRMSPHAPLPAPAPAPAPSGRAPALPGGPSAERSAVRLPVVHRPWAGRPATAPGAGRRPACDRADERSPVRPPVRGRPARREGDRTGARGRMPHAPPSPPSPSPRARHCPRPYGRPSVGPYDGDRPGATYTTCQGATHSGGTYPGATYRGRRAGRDTPGERPHTPPHRRTLALRLTEC